MQKQQQLCKIRGLKFMIMAMLYLF